MLGRLGVAQPGDGEAGPVRAHVVTPGRPALDDCQMPGPGSAFDPDLIAEMLGDALAAPAVHVLYVQFRQL